MIYKFNKKPIYDIEGVEIYNNRYRNGKNSIDDIYYDYGICVVGNSVGKEVFEIGTYANEVWFKSKDKYLIELIKNINWKEIKPYNIGVPGLNIWEIKKHLQPLIKIINNK